MPGASVSSMKKNGGGLGAGHARDSRRRSRSQRLRSGRATNCGSNCGMYFSATAPSEKDHGMPVKRSRPLQRRLPDLILDIGKDLTGIGLVPAAVQVL